MTTIAWDGVTLAAAKSKPSPIKTRDMHQTIPLTPEESAYLNAAKALGVEPRRLVSISTGPNRKQRRAERKAKRLAGSHEIPGGPR